MSDVKDEMANQLVAWHATDNIGDLLLAALQTQKVSQKADFITDNNQRYLF